MKAVEEHAEGLGPFTTRLTWSLVDGRTAVWESRLARKRGRLAVRAQDGAESRPRRADSVSAHRLLLLNAVAAGAFLVGGALFAAGAAFAQSGGGAGTSAWIYFAGGLFFNTGGYASVLQAVNAPRRDSGSDALTARRWRWWSYEPARIDWLSTVLLFAGTIVFGVNLLSSLLQGLSTQQVNRFIWAPDMIGCTLFLISGHLALVEVCHGRPTVRAHDLGWWIVVVNQLGSALFMASALAAFTRPATGSEVNVDIANWGTLTGALCFSVAGAMQFFERP
ncbi:hypothetical protein [Streptomyces fructofermentans]|uniref:NADH-ubiquinone oxidoreductase n=1 Tax=Streptomyces fructofermentans TaxID=152141 RepID=A0A918KGA8_9ACTN|nr:hypothetical protein [Streptomyces fructofermentans]GGX62720.1 hypothetical protein GCM10010515_32980 [Streptomyces fructofermentans]